MNCRDKKRKLVYGVGVNDASYNVYTADTINGKTRISWRCPFYLRWLNMLKRAYSEKFHDEHPTYTEVTVCDEWLTFSSFRSWMVNADWVGKHLDKDIINKDSNQYSPSNCAFVDRVVNNFTIDRGAARGNYPIGTYLHKKHNNFSAQCWNPFSGKRDYLGSFDNPADAHDAWKKRKHELSVKLASSNYIQDERVRVALMTRYL